MTTTLQLADQLAENGACVGRIINHSSRGVAWERSDHRPFADRPFVFTYLRGVGLGSSVFDLTLTEAEAML